MPRPIGSLNTDTSTGSIIWYTYTNSATTSYLYQLPNQQSTVSLADWAYNASYQMQNIGTGDIPIVNLNIERGHIGPRRSAREEEELEDRLDREVRARRAERIVVIERSELLLKENLTPEQLKELKKDKWFTVKNGERTYRIREGRAQNIDELDDKGYRTAILCVHPVDSVPNFDTMLAQKLLIEHDLQTFLRTANRMPCQ